MCFSLSISGMRVSNNRGVWNVGTVKSLMKRFGLFSRNGRLLGSFM